MQPTRTSTEFAPWMRIAQRYAGLRERNDAGELDDTVRDFFRFTRFPRELVGVETSWCAAFACTVLEISGIDSPKSAKARHFLSWPGGVRLVAPVYGSILVFSRGQRPGTLATDERGHVAFCERPPLLAGADVMCFGGNQDNAVCSRRKAMATLLGTVWPKGWPLPPDGVLA